MGSGLNTWMKPNERSYKTEAVILRRSDFGETDFLVTLYTPQYGKIRAIAKGARKATGRLTGQVELFAQVNLLLSRGRELHIITQAETQQTHAIFQQDLERSVIASHFAELLDQFAFEDEENTRAYQLIVAAFSWLQEADSDLNLLARYYEFHLLRVMGYEPALFRCAISNEVLEAEAQFFSPVDGGVVAPAYAEGRSFMKLSLPVFKVLRHFRRSPWETVRPLQLTAPQHQELERILHTYLTYLLERRLQSVGVLRQIKRES